MSDNNNNTSIDQNKLVAERRQKLTALREQGFDFPNEFRRNTLAGQVKAIYTEHSNELLEERAIEVQVGGRMMTRRIMGKASFATYQDRSGKLQLFVQRDAVGEEVYKSFKTWDLGDIVWALSLIHILTLPTTPYV